MREGARVLMNEKKYSSVIDFWYFKFDRFNEHVAKEYGSDKGGEKRKRFWSDLSRVLDRVDNGYRLDLMGNLNVLIVDCMGQHITVAFIYKESGRFLC